MTKSQNQSIELRIAEALEAVDHAELAAIEGGAIWGPSCPSYPPPDGDPLFAAFGVPGPIGPIC